MTMLVLVSTVEYDGTGTVGQASGVQVVDGDPTSLHVTFAVDHRMLLPIVDQLLVDGRVLCEVEGWQVLSSRRMPEPEEDG